MNRLEEIWNLVLEQLRSLLTKIEESSYMERGLLYLESLDPTRQALVKSVFRLLVFIFVARLMVLPFYRVYETKRNISTYEESAFELQRVAQRATEVVAQAPKPPQFQSLPASNSAELENSIKDFLANIGVAEDLYQTRADGKDRLKIQVDDLTLKQALALVFQFDGWYPNVETESLDLKVHPQNNDRLTLNLDAFIASALPGGGRLSDHDTDFESTGHEVGGGSRGGRSTPGGGGFDDEGGQEFHPPPNGADNNGGVNNVPPPPPPPNFDENFEEQPPIYDEGGGGDL